MTRAAIVGVALAGALALAGCASTVAGTGTRGSGAPAATSPGFPTSSAAVAGSNAALTPSQLERAAKDAFTSARAFRMKGAGNDGSEQIAFDIHFGESSSDGSMTVAGLRVQLRYVRPDIYMKAGADFWKSVGGVGVTPSAKDQAALALLRDKWVHLRAGSAGLAQLGQFAIREKFLAQAGSEDPSTTYSKGPSTTINGVLAVSFKASDDGTVVYVPASGTPYPIRIVAGGGAGTFDLTDWNVPFSAPTPPADQVVELPK
jgi:hypothetical protein